MKFFIFHFSHTIYRSKHKTTIFYSLFDVWLCLANKILVKAKRLPAEGATEADEVQLILLGKPQKNYFFSGRTT